MNFFLKEIVKAVKKKGISLEEYSPRIPVQPREKVRPMDENEKTIYALYRIYEDPTDGLGRLIRDICATALGGVEGVRRCRQGGLFVLGKSLYSPGSDEEMEHLCSVCC